jgi:hypothetical protein
MMERYGTNLERLGPEAFEGLMNFFRVEHQPLRDPQELRPYALSRNGNMAICLNLTTQPKARTLLAARIPGLKGFKMVSSLVVRFLPDRRAIDAEVKQLAKDGVRILNARELEDKARHLL